MKTSFICISLVTLISYSTTQAQDERLWRASAGVGLAMKKNQRVGNTYENMDKKVIVKTIPMVQASYWRFSLGQQGISFRAFGNQMVEGSVFIKREGDRYHGLGMNPRKDSPFVGISAKYFNYGLTVSKDIAGRSKGVLTQFSYGKLFPISEGFILRAGATLEWADDKYAEYYYGVRSHEVAASRREYHLTNYFQPGLNVLPIYKMTQNVSLMGALGVKLIPKKVRNSPTMKGNKLDIGGFGGITYTF